MTTGDGVSLNSGFPKILCTPEKPLYQLESFVDPNTSHISEIVFPEVFLDALGMIKWPFV